LKQSSQVPSAQSVNNIAENVLWGDEVGLSRAGAGHRLPPTGQKEGRSFLYGLLSIVSSCRLTSADLVHINDQQKTRVPSQL